MHFLVLYALLAAFAHSVHSLANRFLMVRGRLGALSATLLVQVITGVVALACILALGKRWTPGAGGAVLGAVAFSLAAFVLTMASFARDDASAVGPILGLKVVIVGVLESILNHHPMAPGVWAGAGMSMVGIAFLSQTDVWSLRPATLLRPGVALMAGAALGLSCSDVFVMRTMRRWGSDSWGATLYIILTLGVCALAGLWLLPRLQRQCRLTGLGEAVGWTTVRPILAPLLCSAVGIFLMQYCFFTSFAVGRSMTLTNIVYNVRGLFLVALAAIFVLGRGSDVERAGWRAYGYRTVGVLFTLGAIVLALPHAADTLRHLLR